MSKDDARPRASSPRAITGSPRAADGLVSQSPSRASTTARLATPVYGSPTGSQLPATRPQHAVPQRPTTPLAGATPGSLPGPGTSSLSEALQGSRGARGSPAAASPNRGGTPARLISPSLGPRTDAGATIPESYSSQLAQSPRAPENIEVLRRHLVGPAQTGSEPGSFKKLIKLAGLDDDQQSATNDDEFSSLQLQGGDTTRHIYRYAERREREQAEAHGMVGGRLRRSLSASAPRDAAETDSIRSIQVPGGFRRDHLRRAAGSPAPPSLTGRHYGAIGRRTYTEPARPNPQFVTSNFIEFLTLYGHFAGEQLDEDDEVLGPDEYFSSDHAGVEDGENGSDDDAGEDSALLTPGKRRRKRKVRDAGKSSAWGAALLLLKSFVGTGVLFLPRAFYNGGMLFSFVILIFLAGLSYYCFLILVAVRLKVPVSYGDMGYKIYGPWFRSLINFSLVLSQIGFTSAYIVFVSENVQAFVQAVTACRTSVEVKWVIMAQMIFFLPISLYRNINNIQKMALVADLFIVLGLIYLYYYDIRTIVTRPGFADFINFNPNSWTLLIGTAIFTFEGVGLVIPIQSGMREPAKFPVVLASVTVIMSVIFISIGALSYAAYGSKTKTVVILNMPQDDPLVNGVQFLYTIAIVLSIPLQIFPAIEITSQQLFSRTGKYNPRIKWQKNCFRFFMVVFCAAIAWVGADDLDKFVSLVGSFACIPLVYIYPPLMHKRIIASRLWQTIVDYTLVLFGVCMMTYTTALTVTSWIEGKKDTTPGYCDDLLKGF